MWAAFTRIISRSGGQSNVELAPEPASAAAVAESSTHHGESTTNTTLREVRHVATSSGTRRHRPYTRALQTNHIVNDSPGSRLVIAPTTAVQTSVACVEGIVRVLDAHSNHHARRVAVAVDNGARLSEIPAGPPPVISVEDAAAFKEVSDHFSSLVSIKVVRTGSRGRRRVRAALSFSSSPNGVLVHVFCMCTNSHAHTHATLCVCRTNTSPP